MLGWTNLGDTSQKINTGESFIIQSWSPFPKNDAAKQTNDFARNDYCMEEYVNNMFIKKVNKTPPPGYRCHLCSSTQHYIQDCDKEPNAKSFTPYQGKKRSCGGYVCTKCKRKWLSFNSYANAAQSCVKCHIQVFATKQFNIKELKRICDKVAGNSFCQCFDITHEEFAVFEYIKSFLKHDDLSYLFNRVQKHISDNYSKH
ncbi:zinc finger CCHC domain-containing protein 24-like [Arctopsyche grandis]|uniref:zinc finger CCHC domain-containing protein 24-like n=1 Tax=Arctopsyche grandis TaxID=121162 RepID=UPI00406D8531